MGSPSRAAAQPSLDQWLAEPVSWHGEVAAGTALTLVNEHGDLRVRGKPADALEIIGFAQHHVDDPRAITIEPMLSGDGWRLEVRLEERPGQQVPSDWAGRRVDLTVYVPWSSPLSVRTADGVLEALNLRAPLEAETATGNLLAGSSQGLRLKTRSGDVTAVLEEAGWSSTATIETHSGAVSLEARDDANAAVTMETRGTLTTDFSLEVERVDLSLRHARARLGAATGKVVITSYQGALYLHEVVEIETQRAAPGPDPGSPPRRPR